MLLLLIWKLNAHSLHLPLLWRHNGRDCVSNHQPHDCLFNHLFRRKSKKRSTLRATGLCVGNSPVTDEFPAQMVSNAENGSIWWLHHAGTRSETKLQLLDKKKGTRIAVPTMAAMWLVQYYEKFGLRNERMPCSLSITPYITMTS